MPPWPAVKRELRQGLLARALELGPAWLAGERSGELAVLATQGLDALEPYFARYLPQLALSVIVPLTVVVAVALRDPVSAVILVLTLPLIPSSGRSWGGRPSAPRPVGTRPSGSSPDRSWTSSAGCPR
ncbi:MAG: hypothetical protein KatS3mg014_1978 [Actinomycetota bacterium]|nr:MAG: hypothetical protein KatS3mg014_1978 [Actinomycetota bacterium]